MNIVQRKDSSVATLRCCQALGRLRLGGSYFYRKISRIQQCVRKVEIG